MTNKRLNQAEHRIQGDVYLGRPLPSKGKLIRLAKDKEKNARSITELKNSARKGS